VSGFYLSLRPLEADAAGRIAESLSFAGTSWTAMVREEGVALVQVRSDREDLWRPATDPETGTTVALAGRIALSSREWERAKTMPYTGGLACRHILHTFLRDGAEFAQALNGAFGIVVMQPAARTVHVVTDRMGFWPLYLWRTDGPPVVGTHPDVLAEHAGATDALDRLSMAEVLATGTASHPHTYYRDVEVMEPGCVYTWRAGEPVRTRVYWEPRYRGDERAGVKELGEDLERALRGAVERRTLPALGPTGVLLSGGADSRAVLYAACEPSTVTSITFYDQPNAEFETARQLAERVGSEHVGLQRDFEHYGRGARKAVRVAGGMWNLLDAHYTEFIPQLQALGLESLLTGCYADYLFKGLTSNRTYKALFGKNLPLHDFASFSLQWYAPHGPVAEAWRQPVRERLRAAYDGLDLEDESDAGRWALELRRLRPVAREADTAGRLLLQRTLPWDPLFADTALVDAYERVPPSLKLNGQVWEDAVGRICRSGGDIANNNSLSRIGASQLEKTLRFLYGVAYRRVFKRDVDGTPLDGSVTRGSWPNFNHYIRHSTVVPELWADPSDEARDVLGDILGTDPWSQPMEALTKRGGIKFLRLLTLKLWLDQRAS
jgi:asparagine synthase (glutamine-hydrolysing)